MRTKGKIMRVLNSTIALIVALTFVGCGKVTPLKVKTKASNPFEGIIGCAVAAPFVAIGDSLSQDVDIKFYKETFDRVHGEVNKKKLKAQTFWASLTPATRDQLIYELNLWLLANTRTSAKEAYKSTAYFFTKIKRRGFDYSSSYKFKSDKSIHYEFFIRGESSSKVTLLGSNCQGKGVNISGLPEVKHNLTLESVKAVYECRMDKDSFTFMDGSKAFVLKRKNAFYTTDSLNVTKKVTSSGKSILVSDRDLLLDLSIDKDRPYYRRNKWYAEGTRISLTLPEVTLHENGGCLSLKKYSEFPY